MDMDERPVANIPSVQTHRTQQDIYKELNIDSVLAHDVGANVSGWYDLVAVLTHVGRAADSGHYIAWTRRENNESKEGDEAGGWWKFDDDKVSPVGADEIAKLEGGGDWHTGMYTMLRCSKGVCSKGVGCFICLDMATTHSIYLFV